MKLHTLVFIDNRPTDAGKSNNEVIAKIISADNGLGTNLGM